jgi:hypothetical protein
MSHQDETERLSSDLALFLSNPTIKSCLADGSLNLSSYSSTITSELKSLEDECITIYRENNQVIKSLRTDMDECDLILASLQEMLLGFQADLGGLSGDIKSLQEQSNSLGCKLQNRKGAEDQLRDYLQRIIVPPSLADMICSGTVDHEFILAVQELERKYQYIHSQNVVSSQGVKPDQTPSGNEMKQHITKLRYRAIGRIRMYFLQTIGQLRRPKTNVRMIQINSLLKYTPLMEFLLDSKVEIYNEVRNVYTESMSTTLYALFRTYAAQLALLDNEVATRKDVIAVEDSALRDVWTRVNMSKRGDAFCLGARWEVLENDTSSSLKDMPILAHVALSEKIKYPYEVIFKSVIMHLMDSVTNEYVFVRKFFQEHGPDAFQGIFGRTLSLILEQLENYLFNCYDCLGLLLMIKLTHANKRFMKERRVDSLDKFFDNLTNLLWPRLKTVMDKQLRSVRDGDVIKLGVIELHAHYVSRRYAEFTCSILQILQKGAKDGSSATASGSGPKKSNSNTNVAVLTSAVGNMNAYSNGNSKDDTQGQGGNFKSSRRSSVDSKQSISHRGSAGDMLLNDLSLLQDEILLLIQRLSESHSTNKKKIIFLINNLDQIIAIFQERRVSGKEFNRFVELLMQQREIFVEEELLQSFSKMIAFVQQTEQHMNRPQYSNNGSRAAAEGNKLEVNAQVVEGLVRDFASSWKQGIEQINKNVLSFFANFRNGMEVLKQVLTQLLLYYTRFQDIIRKVWRSKPPAFCKDLVSTSVILAEIKKYALAI